MICRNKLKKQVLLNHFQNLTQTNYQYEKAFHNLYRNNTAIYWCY
jgi:hypothetical protein